jgi:dimethylhistidine N-methyltransferase
LTLPLAGAEARRAELLRVVREGLARTPKALPPSLFYDAAGSALFERITQLPEYYPTRTELGLFEAHAADMVGQQPPFCTALELGAGSGMKTRVLLQALRARSPALRYHPLDVSPAALQMARQTMEQALPGLSVLPIEDTYGHAAQALRGLPGPRLVLFIGSSIGNFEPDEATALLRELAQGLERDDAVLLGTDLRKPEAQLRAAYDDAQGVTAAFNLNLLERLNRELGADFELSAFTHVALWNAQASRIEMHLQSERAQRVSLPALALTVAFARGERLHTENSYKFTGPSGDAMLEGTGLRRERTWADPRGWFAEHRLRRG